MLIAECFKEANVDAGQKTGPVYCDCDGTLFQTRKNGSFNEDLFKFLITLKKAGHDVVIFSGESAANEARVRMYSMKYTGNPEFFEKDGLVITPKDAVSGAEAFLVIDDNHSTHAVQARHEWDPDDEDLMVQIADIVRSPEKAKKFGPSFNYEVV